MLAVNELLISEDQFYVAVCDVLEVDAIALEGFGEFFEAVSFCGLLCDVHAGDVFG